MNEKKNIGQLFDRIARKYDLLNHLLSLNIDRYWRKNAVNMLESTHGGKDNCLDVAIGTADLAIQLARKFPSTQITGIDLSAEMMRIGGQKTKNAGLDNRISFLQASALDIPFPDESFDVVTCAYGVRNFSDLDKGLKEMCRVLKTHGTLLILEFSYPRNRLIALLYDIYFSHIMPLIGKLLSHDPTAYSYLNRSVKNFVWGERMCSHLQNAGFSNVTFHPLTFGITTAYLATK